jgi:amidophosphoribosyltransferase
LGKILADKEDILNKEKNDYIVIGIPLTGILYGKSYAKRLGLNYKQLIKKKDNTSRTFIILNNSDRKDACNKKFIYDKKIKDKKIVIVDDTIVRGNVIKSIINNLKKYGAKEIHVRIPAPPVIDICELGIAIHNKDELIMNNRSVKEVIKELGVDSLNYLYITEMKNIPKDCYSQCFTGKIVDEIKNWKPVY